MRLQVNGVRADAAGMGRAPWRSAGSTSRRGGTRLWSSLVGIIALALAGVLPSPLGPAHPGVAEGGTATERPIVRPRAAPGVEHLGGEGGPARPPHRRGPDPAPVSPPTAPPPLPVPAPLPDPAERVALVEVGRIRIPRIEVDEVIREGVQQMVIDAGVAHWPGTPAPGGWGNAVLAGHRSTHTAPFLRLGELTAGDLIELADATGAYRYRVTGLEVVGVDALWIVDQRPGHHLTIFTCHPIGSSAQRLVVRAELIGSPRP